MRKFKDKLGYEWVALSTVAALSLAACGGGGGGGGEIAAAPPPSESAPAPAPAPADAPAPAPAPAPVAATASVRITALAQQAAPNVAYTVAATQPGTVVVTLPATLATGDTVSVLGESTNRWQIAQNAGQSVLTAGLNGNVAPGTAWTPRLAPKVWHWLSSSAAGDVLLAGEASGGFLNTSVDGGVNWTTGDSVGATWISSDMTPTGDRMVAVQYGGGLYMSTDRGTHWTAVTSTSAGVSLSNQAFESVTISQDGQRIVAVVQNGPIYVSSNAGQTWAAATLAGSATAFTGWWRAVDSSADGMAVMAADHNGGVYRSIDGGLTWTPSNITIGGSQVVENWYRLKMSNDGKVIAVVGNSFGGSIGGTGIYISRDSGASWSKATSLQADYSAIAMSSDGNVIDVTVSNPNPNSTTATARATGRVLRSTDAGVTFATLTLPGTDTDWRATAMSADGNKLAVAAGLFDGNVTGQLYTSLGNRTSIGALGSITAGQNDYLNLQYLGNGQFKVLNSSGGPFSIK